MHIYSPVYIYRRGWAMTKVAKDIMPLLPPHIADIPLFSPCYHYLWGGEAGSVIHIEPVRCLYSIGCLYWNHWQLLTELGCEVKNIISTPHHRLLNCCTVERSQDRIVILNIWRVVLLRRHPNMLLSLSGQEPQSLHPNKMTTLLMLFCPDRFTLQSFSVVLCCWHREAWLWKGSTCC